MASCRDGAPTTVPATISTPRHTAPHGKLAAPTPDLDSASHQAHLRCNSAAFGPMAATHTATTGDHHAGRHPMELAHQHLRTQGAPTDGAQERQLPAPSVGRRSGRPPGWPRLGDRRAWTTHNPRRMSSAQAWGQNARRPLTWICASPGPPTWSSLPSRSRLGGSSRTYTTS